MYLDPFPFFTRLLFLPYKCIKVGGFTLCALIHFLFFLFSLVCSSSPMTSSRSRFGALCLEPFPFLSSSIFSSVLPPLWANQSRRFLPQCLDPFTFLCYVFSSVLPPVWAHQGKKFLHLCLDPIPSLLSILFFLSYELIKVGGFPFVPRSLLFS